MIRFFIYSMILSLFSTINGMEQSHKKPPMHIKTTDNQIVLVDKVIAQQSNLFTVLKDIYKGTEQQPLFAPVTKAELDIFCTAVRQPASAFATKLNDKEYSFLMDIAEKLKAQLFYADLMEQALPVKDLINHIAQFCLNKAQLKKAIYKKCLTKKSITLYQNRPETKILSLSFNNNGYYFTETIMQEHNYYITNLWDAQKFKKIKQFMGMRHVTFSPNNSFLVLSNDNGRYSLYFILEDKLIIINNQTIRMVSPKIHQNCNSILIGNNLHTINNKQNISRTLVSEIDYSDAVFHPSLPLIISAQPNNDSTKTEIIAYALEKKAKQRIGQYEKNDSMVTSLSISPDGSLLSINSNILLNIQDPYNPIFLQHFSAKANCYARMRFVTRSNIIFFEQNTGKFFLFNKKGKEILSNYGDVEQIITNSNENYIALLFNNGNSSTIKIFNSLDLKQDSKPLMIKESPYIRNIAFIKNQLLLTQSYITQLWDMEGDEILNFGNINYYAIHPQKNSIIATHSLTLNTPYSLDSFNIINGPTELCYYNINTAKAQKAIKEIPESLTLSQALLLNNCFAEKVKKQKKLYPNLPDGRALACLADKHTFLAKNLALWKKEYVPARITCSQEK